MASNSRRITQLIFFNDSHNICKTRVLLLKYAGSLIILFFRNWQTEHFNMSPTLLTIVISLRILAAELCANNLEQMKSVNVASSSPIYSMIFLLIQGFILLSINTYKRSKEWSQKKKIDKFTLTGKNGTTL